MAVRDGLVAAVLNRPGSLGPAPGKRSRGELPLIALEAASADEATRHIADLDAGEWRSFNLVLADRDSAWFLFGTVCASLLGIPAEGVPAWLFAAGPPDRAAFATVTLP